jgi:hypothetical protein
MEGRDLEFVIWGKPAGVDVDSLLLASVEGEPIKDRKSAEKYMKILGSRHGCRDMRIQEIDLAAGLDWNPANFIR